ncbi:MAG: ribosomal protein methylthiotransferase accessory factor [Acidobacteriota bacterium]|jgi:ribosomal protein S12 methylthiotransferase accessory factor|nr:ribosomal protein methylthiotransferase accessory factor [Acidobacteriota bacterium]
MRPAFYTASEIVERVMPLVGKRTGMVGPSVEIPLTAGNAEICVYGAPVPNLQPLSRLLEITNEDGSVSGTGASLYRELAHAKAYCEALERYCNVVPGAKPIIVATRDELGEDAVDMELFPRCSDEEYAHPRNTLVPPNNKAKMRWVEGYSLIDGRPQWVPLVSAYVGIPFEYPDEVFSLPISTGCALAASYEQAVASGIGEAIERDALMLAWYHRLPLPRVDVSAYTDPEFLERMRRVERAGVRQIFFDATTDLGVATIYALQIAPNSPLYALLMAATRLRPSDTLSKVIEEAAGSRFGLEKSLQQPLSFDVRDYRNFRRLTDGALFYGDPANFKAFDFLFKGAGERRIEELPVLETGDPEANLARLVDIFRQRNLELLVVDLTLPQVRDIGMYVVKVIAPQLVPLSPDYNARFTAMPRLYEAPARMGYPVKAPHELNPWPQPFA